MENAKCLSLSVRGASDPVGGQLRKEKNKSSSCFQIVFS